VKYLSHSASFHRAEYNTPSISGTKHLGIGYDDISYGGAGNDTFTGSEGNNTFNGGGGINTVDTPSGLSNGWSITQDTAGDVILDGGNVGDGYYTLTNIQLLSFAGSTYDLVTAPASGGVVSVYTPTDGSLGSVVVDSAGNDGLNFDGSETSYWFAGDGSDTANLNSGDTEIYLAGPESDYTVTSTGSGEVTVTDTSDVDGTGTKTINIGAGTGEIVFGDGNEIGLGDSNDGTNYPGTGNNSYSLGNGSDVVHGTGAINTVLVGGPDTLNPYLSLEESSSGVLTAIGTNPAGFEGTAVLSNIQIIKATDDSYDLLVTSATGGSLTISTPTDGTNGSVVVDGPGNDNLVFDSTETTYWFVGGGNDSATIENGTNIAYFAGAESDYTISQSSNVLTVANNNNMDGTGTKTITLSGVGEGQLIFGDGNSLVYDGSGNYTLDFTGTGTNTWTAGPGNTTATLAAGTTVINFPGAQSDYTFSYDNMNTLTVTNNNGEDGVGQKVIIRMGGGVGYLAFSSSIVSVGAAPYYTWPATQYGTSGNDTFYIVNGNYSIYGGVGTDTVAFSLSNLYVPDQRWTILQNAAGEVTMTSNISNGFTGLAILNGIEEIIFPGTTYNLLVTPTGGGSLAIGAGNASIVLDEAGTDTISFDNTYVSQYFTTASYWHAAAGQTTATLYAGTTEIYLQGASSDYTEQYNGTNQLIVTNTNHMDGTGTKTLILQGGSGELVFGSGNSIALGSTSTGDAVEYGGSENDTFTLANSSATINGGGGTDIVVFSGSTAVPVGTWSITENSTGQVLVTGPSVGYAGTATLTSVEQLTMDGLTYGLIATPTTGGATTIATPAAGLSGTVVVDGAAADALTFSGTGTSYWHVGGGNNTATLSAGTTEIYFTGAESQYTVTYNGTSVVTVKNTATNVTDTLTLTGGSGELVFASGSSIALGSSATGDSVEYGGSANDTFTLASATASINGGGGTDTVVFSGSTAAPTGAWSITENSSSQILVTGSSVGYAGTATLTAVEQLKMNGLTYALKATPVAGGSTTIGTPGTGLSGTIVADGAGADALTFSGTGTSYWHVGGGNNTATLSAGTTEIYFTGAESQYTEIFNGSNVVTVKNTATSATDAVTLSGGTGELVFASGSNIALNKSGDTTIYGGSTAATLTGTSGADTIYAGSGADTLVGNGGADTYMVGVGTTTESIHNGLSSSNTAAGTLEFTGSIDASNLWLQQSGNNLVVDVLGTTRQAVVQNWFASGDTYAQTSEIQSADALKLDTQVASLVQAMATFAAGVSGGFNPQTTTDTTLTNSSYYGTLTTTDHNDWHS
jgi:Ca2+-binding RTX toxin-like protein